jgi:alpha-L-fucosidase
MKRSFVSVLALIASTAATTLHANDRAIKEWQTLHYGMFVCFGMNTFTGLELDPGTGLSTTYAPTKLDVDQWICVAKQAGMNYAVLTAKHVSGHCLWDSKVRWQGREYDYDVATSSNTNDVVALFMAACKKYGVAPGLYYCIMDLRNNSAEHSKPPAVTAAYFQLVQDQLAELQTRYSAVRYLWLDIPRDLTAEQRRALYDQAKRRQPACVVLFNYGLATQNQTNAFTIATVADAAWPTDVLNSERWPISLPFQSRQAYAGKKYTVGYEHCDCIGKDWFWTADDRMRSTGELFALYDRVVNQLGGNLLLSVGPDRSGLLDETRIRALMDLKLKINSRGKTR